MHAVPPCKTYTQPQCRPYGYHSFWICTPSKQQGWWNGKCLYFNPMSKTRNMYLPYDEENSSDNNNKTKTRTTMIPTSLLLGEMLQNAICKEMWNCVKILKEVLNYPPAAALTADANADADAHTNFGLPLASLHQNWLWCMLESTTFTKTGVNTKVGKSWMPHFLLLIAALYQVFFHISQINDLLLQLP